jgi:hypothetical protein
MSNTSLAIILLATVLLTLMLTGASGISSIKQAKADTSGQHESTTIGDKDLLQAHATIIAGILILLTISTIKETGALSIFSLIGLFPFALSAIILVTGQIGTSHWEGYMFMSRFTFIVGFLALFACLISIITSGRLLDYVKTLAQAYDKKTFERAKGLIDEEARHRWEKLPKPWSGEGR